MSESGADENEYVLGTGSAELRRLGFQHQLWSAYAVQAWERAGFAPGDTLLDLGCGPGYATWDLARLVGDDGQVIAVDVSERFVRHLEAEARLRGIGNVVPQIHDVQALDLRESSLDGAYTRWVLCFLPDPEAAVAGVARALRPGAAFVVQDYTRYGAITLAPQSAAFARVIEAVQQGWRAHGGDPDVGTRVPEMMVRHGLRIQSVRPIVRIARPQDALWKWPETFFRGFLPGLVADGFLAQNELDAFWTDWNERSRTPGSFLLSPPMVEVIGVKEEPRLRSDGK